MAMTVSLYSEEREFIEIVYMSAARMGRNDMCGLPDRQG